MILSMVIPIKIIKYIAHIIVHSLPDQHRNEPLKHGINGQVSDG